MRRKILATLLILHGLAHAAPGMWAAGDAPSWVVTPLWGMALLGYLAAGLGLFRVPLLRRWWTQLLIVATASSILLLAVFAEPVGVIGASFDVALFIVAFEMVGPAAARDVAAAEELGVENLPHPILHKIAWAIGGVGLLYAFAVVAMRPVYLRWGTTPEERTATLLGDDLVKHARYRVDHAITIRAPADSVWPWLAQLGQDRAGFYSYAWLERLVGDDIHNTNRVHPEWQRLGVGDTVFATQADYFGGRLGHPGWRVTAVEPGRALYLENWGAFVLRPIDSATTRLVIRTRGAGTPSFTMVALGPFNVFVFEPAHFIMQRGMMRGIRSRAEAAPARRYSVRSD
jgi:hypothetical protein